MRRVWPAFGEVVLLPLTAFAILWRGGKSVDATFLLAGVIGAVVIVLTLSSLRSRSAEKVSGAPLSLWLTGFAFLLWSVIAFLQSQTQNYGLDEILRDGALFLVFVTVARTSHTLLEDRWRRFAETVALAAAAAAAIGIAVYLLQPVDRFVGTFFDARFHTDYWPNAWAEFVLLAWPLAFAVLLRAAAPVHRIGWMLLLGLLFGSLFLSYSRGAFLAFCGQAVLLACVSFVLRFRGNRHPVAAPLIILSMSAALGVVLFTAVNVVRSQRYDVQSVTEKITFTATEGTSSIDERGEFWSQAIDLTEERPLFGWGPYSFRFVQPRLASGVLRTSDHPHNVFLKLSMERGVPAALLFATFLFLLFFGAVRTAWQREKEGSPSVYAVMGAIAAAGVLAHNLIDYNLQFVGIALPLWIVFGLLSASSGKRRAVRGVLPEAVIAAALVILVAVEGVFLVLSSFGRRADADGNATAAISWYEMASGEIFSRDMGLAKAHLLFETEGYERGSAALVRYEEINPEDPRLWEMRGWEALEEQKSDEAALAFERAYANGKWTNIGILHGLLEARRGQKRELGADEYREYVNVAVAYGNAILKNEHFIALSSNVRELQAVAGLLPFQCSVEQSECNRDAETLDLVSAAAGIHAQEERRRYDARPAGYLW